MFMDSKYVIKIMIMKAYVMIKPCKKSKILYYHDVFKKESYKSLDSNVLMGTNIEMFKKHLKVIKNEGYNIVRRITKEENEVAIMFDDGFRGIWDNRQFFYDNNIMPTVFLAVDLIGKEGFLNKKEILELQDHGFVFQSHSWTHSRLDVKSRVELVKELKESKEHLLKLLNNEVDEICLPIGYYSDSLIDECEKYGYKEIYSSVSGDYNSLVNGHMRTRNLCQFATPYEVKLILRGGGNALRRREEKLFYTKQL